MIVRRPLSQLLKTTALPFSPRWTATQPADRAAVVASAGKRKPEGPLAVTAETSGPAQSKQPFDTASIDWIIKAGCLAILAYWSMLLVQPFLTMIVWSIILTVVLYPIFDWLVSRLHLGRALAALLITIASFVVVLGPASWLALSLVTSVRSIVDMMGSGSLSIPPPPDAIKAWPLIGDGLYDAWDLASTNMKALLIEWGPQLKPVGTTLLSIAGSTGLSALQFLAAVAISGFLFLPGPSMVSSFKLISERLVTKRGEEFVDLAGATIRNLARGVIGISLLQALLAGIGFIVAGVPAAGLFSFLVLLLGIVQVGATIVVVPLIIWSWLTMNTTEALLFTAYMAPVNFIDNLLRPFVLAHGLKTPMPVILAGVIGGLLAHGMIGVFIGPIVLAIAWELVVAWMREETEEAEAAPAGEAERR
jgi:predicted PurR-regulated permease PerM